MLRSLCYLKLCILCAAIARGVAIPFAAERATMRPPDAGSTHNDQAVGKHPLTLTATSTDFSAEPVQDTVNAERRLLQSDASGYDGISDEGFKCNLTSEARDRYKLADNQPWLVDDEVLEEVNNDLQLIVNCTREGDEIAFDVTDVIQPQSLVIIPWRLTLSSHVEDASGSEDASTSKTKTRFTCPRENTGIFVVQAMSITFSDLIFEGCTTDGKNESEPIVRVMGCNNRNVSGIVSLLRVTFRNNTLVGASGLRMSESSCSELEMVDVEIADNECSSDGCGVFLAMNSSLENCAASGNRVVKSDEQMSSLLYAPASSNTTIQGFAASRNNITVVRLRDGLLSLSNASFMWNSLDNKHGSEMNASCVHLDSSYVEISNCSFIANEGYNKSAIFAGKSNIFVSGSEFRNNVGSWNGGFMYAQNTKVTLESSFATNNSAGARGGFIYTWNSTVKLENTTATNNNAMDSGGFIAAIRSTVKLENTSAKDNSARTRGGFIYTRTSKNVTLKNTAATNNSAGGLGGFITAFQSNVTLENTTSTNSNARRDGGFMYAGNSTVKLENTTSTNSNARRDGGFMYAGNSTVKLENTTSTNSNAQRDGGFMYAGNSTVKLENTTSTNSNARRDGGFMYAGNSTVTLENTTSTNSSVGVDGGLVYGISSELRITLSQFSSSNSISGGFVALDNSSIFMNDSEIVGGRSKNGGAIWMEASNMKARNLTITHCRADNSGGGVMSLTHSTFLCVDCKFENNSAEKGNGGAVFFDSHPDQNLALQIVQSRFENNEAELGGGVFFECSEIREHCITHGTDCPFMALTTTNFSGNKAEVAGGAIFAGCVEAIRFDCPKASPDTGLEFYQGEDWKALKQLESEADICPSWKGNHGNLYGPDVGTYATYANMTIEKAMRSVCVGGEDCVIDGYRTGEDLPEARVILLDGLGQGSPISHRGVRVRVNANLSSPDGEFMVGSIVLPMEEGSCTFQSVRGFVPPGKYELTVGFGEEAIKDIGIIVEVRDCSTGEIVAPATGVCQECSNTTYNFDLSAGACEPCPENGNCESRVITPGDGYWQKTPCSKHIHRCLPTSSCKRENRSKSLTDLVGDAANCTFDRSVIENYTQAQCAKGHEGPLCGSCSSGYGSGLSAKCKRCLKKFVNVALILTSILFLIGLTGITVNGTLNVGKTDQRELRRQNAFTTRSVELRSLRSLEDQSERANTDESSRRGDSPSDESTEGVPADEALLAKWKAVEMFKIILSFVQTTILLASLDVGWGLPLLILAEAAEYISGLASEGNRRSVTCLDPSAHSTALAFAFNLCFVPVAVFLFWIVLWTVTAVGYEVERPRRYLAKRCMLSLMALWYVTLVPVVKTAMSIGLCVDVHDSTNLKEIEATHKYWAVDTEIKCYEDDHARLLYFVVLAFVCPAYGGLLIVFSLFLRASAEQLRDKNGWIYETTGFLYRSYSLGRRRYWEVAIVLRKVAIAFMVFCAHLYDSVVPITGVAHVITLAIVAQIVAKPYRKEFEDLDRFDLASMFVSLVTILMAITLKQEDFPDDVTRELSTAACVLLNLATFVVFSYYNLKFLTEYLKHRLSECDENHTSCFGVFGVLRRWIGYQIQHLINKPKSTPEVFETAEQSDLED